MNNYVNNLENLTGQPNLTATSFHDICQYIYWAELSNIELKFSPTDEVNNYCMANGDSNLYSVSYGHPELWQLGAFEFLN